MPKILFICTMNRFRSPLGAAFFRNELINQKGNESWQVQSAGTWTLPGQAATQDAIIFANSHDIDLNSHRSTVVSRELLSDQDLILVMEAGHKEALILEFPEISQRVFLLTQLAGLTAYDIPDPYATKESPFTIAEELQQIIQAGFPRIIAKAQQLSVQSEGKVK